MAKLSTYALAGALAFALAPVAGYAADLPEPPALEPTPAPVEFGSAWYLRGDVGYKAYRDPKASYSGAAYAGAPNFRGEKMKDAAIVGGGVGYKFNQFLRSDVTVDYETPAKWTGNLPFPGGGCPSTKGCGSHDSAKISAVTIFWNGYIDLFNAGGFTPYVGGGVGVARLDVTKYESTPFAGCPAKICGSGKSNYAGDANWNFAWNLQAGAAYHFTDNLLLDANYRFVDLGDAKTKQLPGKGAGKVKIDDIQAHEVRVGFRYLLD